MPTVHPSSNPFKNRRMRDAAQEGMLITMRCNGCHRVTHFWAADLFQVLGDHQVHIPPWPCSRCRCIEGIDVTWSIPGADKLRELTVRRPVRKIEKWLWRNEKA